MRWPEVPADAGEATRCVSEVPPGHTLPGVEKKRWKDIDPRLRRALVLVGAVEAGLKFAALIDLARRPARRVRGSKAKWAAAITVVNAAGAVPIVYFLRGRR
jgi:hypothetical protein